MPYTYSARGDYYKGDYYRGDFFKSLVRGVGGAIKGFVTGGPAGAITGGVAGLVGKGAHPNLPQPKSQLPMIAPPTFAPTPLGQGISNYPVVTDGDTDGGGSASMGGMIPSFSQTFPPTKGYHLNKSTYETRGGGTSRWPHSLQIHPKGTVLVRNRRMNVGNARALKRSLRRAAGFARLARRVMSFTHPRAGRGHFKLKRRAKR